MKQMFSDKPGDIEWLLATHLKPGNVSYLSETQSAQYRLAEIKSLIIHGNEDCPERIEVYFSRHPRLGDHGRAFELAENDEDDDWKYRELFNDCIA